MFIGPIVGIFTAGFTNNLLSPLGIRTHTYAKFISSAEKIGALPVLFGLQHIDWEKGLISGYYYEQDKWIVIDIPFPNVIYDRLPNRKVENLQKVQEIKRKLIQEYGIPWYNPGFFNKLDVYKMLQKNEHTKKYLPKTIPLKDYQSIAKMLDVYDFIYIKPENGSLGNEVYKIKKYHSKKFYCLFRDEKQTNRLFKYSSIEKLYQHLFAKRKNQQWIIQQGIHLIKHDQQFVDFRIHTNKNVKEWTVTVIAAKVSGNDSATTHLLSGGEVKTLAELFPDRKIRAKHNQSLINAALTISKEMEKQCEGILGEIGFDLGIDQEGNIWLLEANSKPGRSIFTHQKLKPYEEKINKILLTFSAHLAEQAIKQPEIIYGKPVLL